MRDDDFNVYADVDREAVHDYDPLWPEHERPARGEVADLEPRPPFAPHPREVKIGHWTYVPPLTEPLCAKCATSAECRRLGCKL